jgi:uncharacterized protein YybS (DUF2232 family)
MRKNFYISVIVFPMLSMFLFVSSWFIPGLGVVLALFAPTCMVLLALSQGFVGFFIGALIANSVLFVLYGQLLMLSYLLNVVLFAGGLVAVARRVRKGSEAYLGTLIVSLCCKLAFMGGMIWLTGENPFHLEPASLRSMMGNFQALWGEAPSHDFSEIVIQRLPVLIPSFLLLSSGLDSFANYMAAAHLSAARWMGQITIPPLPPFAEWKFPRSLLLALLISLMMPLFRGDQPDAFGTSVEVNLKVVVNVIFFIQGLATAWWWMGSRKLRGPVKALVTVILLFPLFSMLLAAIGVGDVWFDLRERKRRDIR